MTTLSPDCTIGEIRYEECWHHCAVGKYSICRGVRCLDKMGIFSFVLDYEGAFAETDLRRTRLILPNH